MFSFLYRVNLKCPISEWLLSVRALTIQSDRFPSCHYCCIGIIALFKHYLLTDLNGSHLLCCAVASIQTNKRQRGANCIRPASHIWYYCGDRKSASFIIQHKRCKIRTCSFSVCGLEGQMHQTGCSEFEEKLWGPADKSQSHTGTVMVQCLLGLVMMPHIRAEMTKLCCSKIDMLFVSMWLHMIEPWLMVSQSHRKPPGPSVSPASDPKDRFFANAWPVSQLSVISPDGFTLHF